MWGFRPTKQESWGPRCRQGNLLGKGADTRAWGHDKEDSSTVTLQTEGTCRDVGICNRHQGTAMSSPSAGRRGTGEGPRLPGCYGGRGCLTWG